MADGIPDRLREARVRAGFKSAAAAARSNGWKESAYRHHENGTRGFDLKTAITYATAFKANPRYILGLDPAFDTAGLHELMNNVYDPTPEVRARSELIRVVRSYFGIELIRSIDPNHEQGVAKDLDFATENYHAFNRKFLDSIDPLLAEGNAAVFVVEGNAMADAAPHGSMLLINTRSKLKDWPTGIFVVYDGSATFVRRVTLDGEQLVFSADHPDVPDERHDVGVFGILGRVVWIGRPVH